MAQPPAPAPALATDSVPVTASALSESLAVVKEETLVGNAFFAIESTQTHTTAPAPAVSSAYFQPPPVLPQVSSSSRAGEAQPPAPAPATASVSITASLPQVSSSPRQPEQLMHKNRLQEFTHKTNIPLPIYQTINEGYQHMPKFRSTVIVNGASYTSSDTFSTRKAAEQNVAELALKSIAKETMVNEGLPTKEMVDEGLPLIHEDTVFCKSILNEFATKMNMKMPTYNTIKPDGLLPVFKSSLVFNDVFYTGSVGKNKKEAEQLAARVAILSLLGDSGMRKVLYDIIKSKVKLYAALNKVDARDNIQNSSSAPLLMNKVQSSGVLSRNDAGVEIALPVANAPTISDSIVPPTKALPNLYSGDVSMKHNFKIAKLGTSLEATGLPTSQGTNLPIEFVHAEAANSVNVSASSSKKRRKNKKKANKRLCTGAQMQMASSPLNQGPPCSVAQ
ncbi:uncharacterized protein LOC133818598 [Humulus lupulus]|uniref:uncharacterized protein LOC133818598 n=1 Tax=Humulus lupulus TaxID=3486 RepID=UPI002B40B9A7|nr:uncharacterized protein LOC133818598 [Humulus lupulus]